MEGVIRPPINGIVATGIDTLTFQPAVNKSLIPVEGSSLAESFRWGGISSDGTMSWVVVTSAMTANHYYPLSSAPLVQPQFKSSTDDKTREDVQTSINRCAGATIRLFEHSASESLLRFALNLTPPDAYSANILAVTEVAIRSSAFLAVSVRDSKSRSVIHFVPLKTSYYASPPNTRESATAKALTEFASTYFSPIAPIEVTDGNATALTAYIKPKELTDIKSLGTPSLNNSADGNEVASVLIVGLHDGRIRSLNLFGPHPTWIAIGKHHPKRQVTALTPILERNAVCVGLTDGHFYIATLDSAVLIASSTDVLVVPSPVSAFAFHVSQNPSIPSLLWVCRGSAPILNSGVPALKGKPAAAYLFVVDTQNAKKWTLSDPDISVAFDRGIASSASSSPPKSKSRAMIPTDDWVYSAITLDSSILRHVTEVACEWIARRQLVIVEIIRNDNTKPAVYSTVYSLRANNASNQAILGIKLPHSSIVDSSVSHTSHGRLSNPVSSNAAHLRSFSMIVETLHESGLQRQSFSSIQTGVLDVLMRNAAIALSDQYLQSTYHACVEANLIAPLWSSSSASSSSSSSSTDNKSVNVNVSDQRRALFDMCLRLSLSTAVAHLVSETYIDKLSDARQLLMPNPEPIILWLDSALKQDYAAIVAQQSSYTRWINLKSNTPFDTTVLMGILNRLHGAIRIGESLLATRRFSNSNVERMVLARKHLEVKLWFLKHCGGPLAAIAEEMLGATSRFQETFRLKREIKRKNATRSMSGMLDRMRVEADSEMFVDSLLRSLNVVSIVPNYPPKNFHSLLNLLLDDGGLSLSDQKESIQNKLLLIYYFAMDVQHFAQRTQPSPLRFRSVASDFARAFGLSYSEQRIFRGLWLIDALSPRSAPQSQPTSLHTMDSKSSSSSSTSFMSDESISSNSILSSTAATVSDAAAAIECFAEHVSAVRDRWGIPILRTLYLQSLHKEALTFFRTIEPSIVSTDDHIIVCHIWLSNGLYQSGLLHQRTAGNRNKSLTPHLLIEFFRWFELNGKMQSLLHLPLTSMEDQYLVYFLKHLLSKKSVAPSPTNIDYLVLFLLQRNRIVEAVTLFDQHSTNGGARLPASIIAEYRSVLPSQQFDSPFTSLDPRFGEKEFEFELSAAINKLNGERTASAESAAVAINAAATASATAQSTTDASARSSTLSLLRTELSTSSLLGAMTPPVSPHRAGGSSAFKPFGVMMDSKQKQPLDAAIVVPPISEVMDTTVNAATEAVSSPERKRNMKGKGGKKKGAVNDVDEENVTSSSTNVIAATTAITDSDVQFTDATKPPVKSPTKPPRTLVSTTIGDVKADLLTATATPANTKIFIPPASSLPPSPPQTPSPTKNPLLFIPSIGVDTSASTAAMDDSAAQPAPSSKPLSSFTTTLPVAGFWNAQPQGLPSSTTAVITTSAAHTIAAAAAATPIIPPQSLALMNPLIPRIPLTGALATQLPTVGNTTASAASVVPAAATTVTAMNMDDSDRGKERRGKQRLTDALRLAKEAQTGGSQTSLFSDVQALLAADRRTPSTAASTALTFVAPTSTVTAAPSVSSTAISTKPPLSTLSSILASSSTSTRQMALSSVRNPLNRAGTSSSSRRGRGRRPVMPIVEATVDTTAVVNDEDESSATSSATSTMRRRRSRRRRNNDPAYVPTVGESDDDNDDGEDSAVTAEDEDIAAAASTTAATGMMMDDENEAVTSSQQPPPQRSRRTRKPKSVAPVSTTTAATTGSSDEGGGKDESSASTVNAMEDDSEDKSAGSGGSSGGGAGKSGRSGGRASTKSKSKLTKPKSKSRTKTTKDADTDEIPSTPPITSAPEPAIDTAAPTVTTESKTTRRKKAPSTATTPAATVPAVADVPISPEGRRPSRVRTVTRVATLASRSPPPAQTKPARSTRPKKIVASAEEDDETAIGPEPAVSDSGAENAAVSATSRPRTRSQLTTPAPSNTASAAALGTSLRSARTKK